MWGARAGVRCEVSHGSDPAFAHRADGAVGGRPEGRRAEAVAEWDTHVPHTPPRRGKPTLEHQRKRVDHQPRETAHQRAVNADELQIAPDQPQSPGSTTAPNRSEADAAGYAGDMLRRALGRT